MRKIFTILTLAAASLISGSAYAANSIQEITPLPGGTYPDNTEYIFVSIGNVSTANVANYPYVYLSWEGQAEYEPTWQSKWAAFESGTDCYTYLPTATYNYGLYVKPDLNRIRQSGATEFTVKIKDWKTVSGNSSANVTSSVNNATYENGVITFTYHINNDGSSGGDTGNTTPVDFQWGETITASVDAPNYTLPAGDFESGGFYVKTNSLTDIGNFAYVTSDYATPIYFDETISTDEGMVYVRNEWFDMPIYVHYSNTDPVEFTFEKGTYQSGTTDPTPGVDATPIEWNLDYTPGERTDVSYSFTGKGTAAQIITNDPDVDLTVGTPGLLFKDGTELVEVQAVKEEAGYIYYTPELEEGATYVLSFYCPTVKFTFSVVESSGEGPVKEPIEVTTGVESTWEADQVYYYVATESGKMDITISYATNFTVEGGMVFTDADHTSPLPGVTTDAQDGYPKYTFNVTEGDTYYFYFTSPTYIMATLTLSTGSDSDEPEYMSAEPSLSYDSAPDSETLFLFWNETIEPINPEVPLEGVLTTADGTEVNIEFNITTYYPGAPDEPSIDDNATNAGADNALQANISELVAQYGSGIYSIYVASIVKNEAGEWNMPVEDWRFEVAVPVKVSDIEPDIKISGDNITISWDDQPLAEYNPDGADILIMSEDYIDEFRFSLTENGGASIVGNSLVIDLTTIDLEADATYVLIVPQYYLYVGEGNEANALIDMTFEAKSSAIGSLNATSSDSAVYNLQGVKVQNPSKGIYIINGRKVVIK